MDGPGPEPHPWPVLIRTATVSASGCIGIDKHLLGVGRRHASKAVTVIRQHRQIAVFDNNRLIAEFTLTGRPGYQAKTHPKRPSVTDVLRHTCYRCPETSQGNRWPCPYDVREEVSRGACPAASGASP